MMLAALKKVGLTFRIANPHFLFYKNNVFIIERKAQFFTLTTNSFV